MAYIRTHFAGFTSGQIVTLVHTRLADRLARDRFEAARFGLSLDELIDLAIRTLETPGCYVARG